MLEHARLDSERRGPVRGRSARRRSDPAPTSATLVRVRLRRFGPLDIDVPVIGLGTWQMEADDRDSAIFSIRRAIDLGMTHIDTAELYGRGAVEEIVGEALAGYRSEAFVASRASAVSGPIASTSISCTGVGHGRSRRPSGRSRR
jgi:aryl-alcohol dehydrogenase-like predicted oxidoreductase